MFKTFRIVKHKFRSTAFNNGFVIKFFSPLVQRDFPVCHPYFKKVADVFKLFRIVENKSYLQLSTIVML